MSHNPYACLRLRIRRIGPKIDLGCGKAVLPGYIGIDIQDHGQDIVWDVRNGIPLPDRSVTHLHSCHFIEHLTNEEACTVFREMLRVCVAGGKVSLRCPHAKSIEARYLSHFSQWERDNTLDI